MTGTTERTPAEELRAAAAKLREVAAAATSAPWTIDDDTLWLGGHVWGYAIRKDDGTFISEGDPAWIALVHPGLAEPLAAWLEGQATRHDEINCLWCAPVNVPNPVGRCAEMADALAVARVLNGKAAS